MFVQHLTHSVERPHQLSPLSPTQFLANATLTNLSKKTLRKISRHPLNLVGGADRQSQLGQRLFDPQRYSQQASLFLLGIHFNDEGIQRLPKDGECQMMRLSRFMCLRFQR